MQQVTVSSKYQVVIPREVRSFLRVRKGQKFNVLMKGENIVLVPNVSIKSLRGFAPKLTIDGLREKKDREL